MNSYIGFRISYKEVAIKSSVVKQEVTLGTRNGTKIPVFGQKVSPVMNWAIIVMSIRSGPICFT